MLEGRTRRHARIRKTLRGEAAKPRLCVFRSNRYIYAQIIDDMKGTVICSVSSQGNKELGAKKKMEAALEVGKAIGKVALDKGIKAVAFDRAGYRYHGRVKALADGARQAGLKF